MTLQRKEKLKAIVAIAVAASIFAVWAAADRLTARNMKCPKCSSQLEQLSASDPAWTGFPVYRCTNENCRFMDTSEYKN